MKRITGLILIFYLVAGWVQAQHYFTRTYTVADGLPATPVFSLTQDTSGVMWFATRSGISSYDGTEWHNYTRKEGLSSYGYAWVHCDEKGMIWAFPNNGDLIADYFDDKGWHRYPATGSPAWANSYCDFGIYYEDGAPVLVAASYDSGIFICRNRNWRRLRPGIEIPCRNFSGLSIHNNQIYCATNQGVYVIKKDKWYPFSPKVKLPSMDIAAVLAVKNPAPSDPRVRVWLMGEKWIGYIEENRFTQIVPDYKFSLRQQQEYSFITADAVGNIFFGSPYYVYYYRISFDKLLIFNHKNSLIAEGATAVLMDREQNTWFTGYRGITCIPAPRFVHYTINEGLYDNEVSAALELSPGVFVFGHNGVLSFLKNDKFDYLNLDYKGSSGIHETRIMDLDLDRAGNLWVAASSLGIARIDKNRKITWYKPDYSNRQTYISVLVAGDGTIYAASLNRLYRLQNDHFVKVSVPVDTLFKIRKLFKGKGKSIFLGSYISGLIELEPNGTPKLYQASGRNGNSIFSLYLDSQDRYWVGTADGLYRIEGSGLVKYLKGDFRIDDPVYLNLEDDLGRLWFGTNVGIYRWDGGRLDHFMIKAGLTGLEVNRDAGFIDTKNNIWFGTINGVTIFQPEYDYDLRQVPPPKVTLKSMLIKSDTILPFDNVTLSSDQNTLNFNFRAVSFIDEGQVFYKCFLEGYDQDWSAEFHQVDHVYRYHNLRPGTYRFHVKARNALGIWSEPVSSGTIRIRQPFYFQIWFLGMCLVGLGLIIYAIVRYFLMTRYNLRLEQTVAERTNELRLSEQKLLQSNQAKDRFFSIIAHDLKNPFNAILGFLDILTDKSYLLTKQDQERIIGNIKNAANHTADLLENLLAWSRTQRKEITLTRETFDLTVLVRENLRLMEPSAKNKNITLDLTTGGSFTVFADRNMINTVVRNLVTNAIKFTFPGGHIRVTIRQNHEEILTTVTDNGCGMSEQIAGKLFKLDEQVSSPGTNNETGTGLGLILCHDFISLHQGRMWVESELGVGSSFHFTQALS